jgi:hypothetical protein
MIVAEGGDVYVITARNDVRNTKTAAPENVTKIEGLRLVQVAYAQSIWLGLTGTL